MKMVIAAGAVILAAVGWFIFDVYQDAGEFKSTSPHFDGQIEVVAGAIGAEDITVSPQGMAFISSDDRRATLADMPAQGAIYCYNLMDDKPVLRNLTSDVSFEFHPHGLSLFVAQDGRMRLFVVNHRTEGDAVELFDVIEGNLYHDRSIRHGLMRSPNDVHAVGLNQFYITNDHGSRSGVGRMLEEYLRLAKTSVVYFDGADFKQVVGNLRYANGINQSPDGSRIYVAATTDGAVHVYDRHPETGDLAFLHRIDLGTGVDNIEVDSAGTLWVGAHPKLLTFVAHSKDAAKLSPSQVLKIMPQQGSNYDVREILLESGERLSGSSVATVFRDRLLVGSVFGDGFLLCTIPTQVTTSL